MKSILQILPVALALFAAPAVITPSVVEGPGRAVVRAACRAVATDVEYHEKHVTPETPVVTIEVTAAPTVPLRGASTPRAPAV